MRIRLRPADRRPPWPWWAAVAIVVWVGLGCAAMRMARRYSQPLELCTLKRVTGLACPTCGTGRSAWHLTRGEVLTALRHQPFMFVAGGVFILITVLRVGFARRIEWETSTGARRLARGIVLAAFLVNWGYVIVFVG